MNLKIAPMNDFNIVETNRTHANFSTDQITESFPIIQTMKQSFSNNNNKFEVEVEQL